MHRVKPKFQGGHQDLFAFVSKGTKDYFKQLKQEPKPYIPECLFQSSCHLDF